MTSISYIIPTIGRNSLFKTINSIELEDEDEVLTVQMNPPGGNWGNAERQSGVEDAQCQYLAFIDDDNTYVKGHRKLQEEAIARKPGYPSLFKIRYPSGRTLWTKRWVRNGNVDANMILVPNDKKRLSPWDQEHSWADFAFINCWLWSAKDIQWVDEVLVEMGHNDEKYEQKLSFKQAKKKGILL